RCSLLLLLPLLIHPAHKLFKLRFLFIRQELSHLCPRLLSHPIHVRLSLVVNRLHLRVRGRDDRIHFLALLRRQPDLFAHLRHALGPPLRLAWRCRDYIVCRVTPVRKTIPKHATNRGPQHEQQRQPLPRLLPGLSVHGRSPCPPTSTSSFSGVGTGSNTDSAEPSHARRVKSSRRNSTAQVVPTTSNTVHSATSRGASRRTPSHTPLLRSSSSFSFARIAAITRAANHGPASATGALSGSSAPRVSARSSTVPLQAAHTSAWPRASLDICARSVCDFTSPAPLAANPSSSSRKRRHLLFF